MLALKAHRVPQGIVLADEAIGRSGPGRDFLQVFTLHEGTKVEIERVEGGWLLVRLRSGLGGWIRGQRVGADLMNGYPRPIAPWARATKFDNFSGNTTRRQEMKNNTPDDFDGFAVEMFLDEDGDYLAHFAELPTVSAFGQTPDEALVELKVAWELMKECYREDGEPIPTANAIQA